MFITSFKAFKRYINWSFTNSISNNTSEFHFQSSSYSINIANNFLMNSCFAVCVSVAVGTMRKWEHPHQAS